MKRFQVSHQVRNSTWESAEDRVEAQSLNWNSIWCNIYDPVEFLIHIHVLTQIFSRGLNE